MYRRMAVGTWLYSDDLIIIYCTYSGMPEVTSELVILKDVHI